MKRSIWKILKWKEYLIDPPSHAHMLFALVLSALLKGMGFDVTEYIHWS